MHILCMYCSKLQQVPLRGPSRTFKGLGHYSRRQGAATRPIKNFSKERAMSMFERYADILWFMLVLYWYLLNGYTGRVDRGLRDRRHQIY